MRRDREAFGRALRRVIAESPWSPYSVALRACLTPPIVCKITTNNGRVRRGATEAQLLQIAVAVWCDDSELEPLKELLNERRHGAGHELRQLFDRQATPPRQIAVESCIGIGTLRKFLDDVLIPEADEAMRLFVAAVVRDQRRTKINALLELAGYYQLLPPLPPLQP